ncbi:hypothetical protein GSI_05244 [Ganoderma sinense ZZ0214-1]|uniref:DUF6534 domain-containing protein n=1 Tax=Ganoderma sinense ZZ0214-1 TaxID=1077348 RepID=A0A2G8SFM4_9APHY|nr:hypothetical protein GSI_05244 [Ganoderma sinense ZZ0214-1]
MATASSTSAAIPSTGVTADPFASLPHIPPLDNTFGALLIGTFVGLIQYGWTTHQSYRYFRMYGEDTWILKSLVAGVLVLETFHSVLCMHLSYFYLTTNYFNPKALQVGVWSIILLGVSTGAVIFLSQLFFLRRVYMIGRRWRPLVAFCALLLLAELGFATAVTVDTFIDPTLHNSSQAWMNSAGVGIAALADTLLTTALIWSLHQSRTGIKRFDTPLDLLSLRAIIDLASFSTDSLIDVLIMYSINTGLATGVANILSFAFAIAMPHNLIYAGIDIVATKSTSYRSGTTGLIHSSSMDMSVIRSPPGTRGTVSRGTISRGGRRNLNSPIDITVTKETVGSDTAWTNSPDCFRYEAKRDMFGEAV